jgi:hypothetical protein
VRYGLGRKSFRILLGDEAGVEIALHETRMGEQRRLERNVARDATNHEPVECLAHAGDRLVAIASMDDQFGDHRVVKHRDLAAFVHAGIDTNAATVGHRLRGLHVLRRRSVFDQATGRTAESCGTDLRR